MKRFPLPLLSAFLILAASAKLSLESESNDQTPRGAAGSYLIDPVTLNGRAVGLLEEGPQQNLAVGRKVLENLLETNPSLAERWTELGAVLAQASETAKAEYCFAQAEKLAPNSGETLLAIADFHIANQEGRKALPYLGRILSRTPEMDGLVFNAFDRLNAPFDEIAVNGGMPRDLRPAEAYLTYLIGSKDLGNARKMWTWMRPLVPDNKIAEQYLTFLLRERRRDEAAEAWISQLETREPGIGKTIFISNGSFEHEPDGTIFDWQVSPNPHVTVARDEGVAHDGRTSLRIVFDGSDNLDYQGVSEFLILSPGGYRFEAFVRTAGITTDKGVGLRLSGDGLNIETETFTGSNDWKKVEKTFSISTPATLVTVQVVRHPSLKFDSKIVGTVWLDGISITRLR